MEAIAAPVRPLVAEARADVHAGADELAHVCDSALRHLAGAPASGDVRRAQARYGGWLRELRSLPRDPEPAALELDRIAALIRGQHALLGGLVTATDWQSPSFGHSLRAQAGRQAGRIVPHESDYKRDGHLDAEPFETIYVAEHVGGAGARAYLTSCGMAAFTTVLALLTLELRVRGPVLLGRSTYHETKALVLAAFGTRVRHVDEENTSALVRALGRDRPAAVFLDSLCNAPGLALPDLDAVLASVPPETWAVVDTTCLADAGRVFASPARRVLVHESLLKLAQLGLDRVSAGVVVARGPGSERLSALREHLGTNIPDASVYALPLPDRALLERRLGRIERNASLIAAATDARWPGRGGLLELDVPDRAEYVERALREARRRGIQLVAGAGFGFDATRIYDVAAERPFLRIAAGAEHRMRTETLKEALAAAL